MLMFGITFPLLLGLPWQGLDYPMDPDMGSFDQFYVITDETNNIEPPPFYQ